MSDFARQTAEAPAFLAGGGEMGALMRAHDWAASPLGPPRAWPQPLRTAIRLLLNAGHPMYVWWGQELLCFYNDAYRASIGSERHPGSLGRPGREVWDEIWPVIGPQIEQVMAGDGTTWHENALVPITRNGRREDVYWTYSYGPIDDEAAPTGVGGVLVICAETTGHVLAEQRARADHERLAHMFEQAPGFMAMLQGPEHRFTLANPSYLRLVGHRDVLGRTVAEALPDAVEQGYLGRLDRVYASGEAFASTGARYAMQAAPGGPVDERFIDFVYQPVTGPGGAVTGIFVEGSDVTDHMEAALRLSESDERQSFLLKLSDALRSLIDPVEIQAEAARVLGEHLGSDRAYYVEVDEARGEFVVARDWHRPEATSHARRYPVEAWTMPWLADGRTWVMRDVVTDRTLPDDQRGAYGGNGIGAAIVVPLLKDGRLVGTWLTNQRVPRDWTAGEVRLVEEVAERTWAALERARAQAALRQSEERFRSFAEASSDVLWIVDAQSRRLEYLSPAFEQVWGRSAKTVMVDLGAWYESLLTEDREPVNEAMDALLTGSPARVLDYRIRRPDGEVRHITDAGFPIRDLDGRVYRVGGVAQDLTERRRAEAALLASERRLRTLTEGIPQLVWTAVDVGRWTWSSPQWSAFTGQSKAESEGLGWLAAVHPDDQAATMKAWKEAMERGGLEVDYRLRHTGTNAYRWFQSRATPVRDEAGHIVEWLGTSTDVQDLREMQERQGVLVAELQHRTRNLMGVVRSLGEQTLRTSRDLGDFAPRFRDRLGALARANGLLSRLDEGRRVTFDELIETEVRALSDAGPQEGKVTLSGPKGVPLRSTGVQTLALALHELATNALKYGALAEAQPAGRLAVTWRVAREEGRPWLHVDWHETDVVVPAREPGTTARGGGGRELIERALPYQLGARTTYALHADGVRCTIALPASNRSAG